MSRIYVLLIHTDGVIKFVFSFFVKKKKKKSEHGLQLLKRGVHCFIPSSSAKVLNLRHYSSIKYDNQSVKEIYIIYYAFDKLKETIVTSRFHLFLTKPNCFLDSQSQL